MHDDRIRALLRTLEADREPDPAFADALYQRLALVARAPRRSRAPFLLLAAALLVLLAASVAVGSSLLRLPVVVVDDTPRPSASVEPTPSSTDWPATPSATSAPGLAFEAPDGVLPPGAAVTSRVDLELRTQPTRDADVVGTAEAGALMLITGPLLVEGARWYQLTVPDAGIGGHVELDPADGTVTLEPVTCPSGEVDLDAVVAMTSWARLACFGDRELTLEGYEMVGFGGFRTGTYEPEWLNGFIGELAISSGGGRALFVRVEPGTVDLTRPPVTSELGTALLRLTGNFNHPASTDCRSTGIAVGDPDGPTADMEPIAAELECREQFVVTAFEVVDDTAGVVGRVVTATADGIAIRADASADAAVVTRVNAGQRLAVTAGPRQADGMDWYAVRLGPGDLEGWISAGPDGTWLMLVADGALAFRCDGCGDAPGLYRALPDGSALTRIGDEQLSDWAWSPDGTRLAAVLRESESGPSSIVVMAPDGGDRRALGEGYTRPTWSPDGSRLAWSDGEAMVVTDADLRPTRIDLETRGPGHVHWSPEGSRLAYTAIDCPACPEDEPIMGDPPRGIWTIGIDGADLRQVTGGDYSGLGGWSPDASRLGVVLTDLSGEFPTRAYTIPAAGGERTFLLDGAAVFGAPAWSPDGTQMAFVTDEGLVVADGEGGNARVVASAGETGITHYVWSPSGRLLAYTTGGATDGSGVDIFVIAAAGGPPMAVAPATAAAEQPAWQPLLEPLP